MFPEAGWDRPSAPPGCLRQEGTAPSLDPPGSTAARLLEAPWPDVGPVTTDVCTLDSGVPRWRLQTGECEPSRSAAFASTRSGCSSPDSHGYFFFPPIVKFSLFFFCTWRKHVGFSQGAITTASQPRQRANLVHGVVDLLQFFVTISGLSERLNHGLLDLWKQLQHTHTGVRSCCAHAFTP